MFQKRYPRLSDIELIALDLTAESLSIDSEYQLFRILAVSPRSKIKRSVYNRRRRKLFYVKECIRKALSEKLTVCIRKFANYHVLQEQVFAKKIIKQVLPKVIVPVRNYIYGYKLHAIVVQMAFFLILKSRKLRYMYTLFEKHKNNFYSCVLIGDKGYLSAEYQVDLFTSKQIKLEVPMRENQHNYERQAYLLRKTRKRIETLFSQLCDQFLIRRNYAKSFDGYKKTILSKITSLTVIQMINKLLNRNINSIKSLVV